MTRHPTRALALCLSAFLAACGGSHDPRTDASDPLVTASTTANDATTAKTSEYTASSSDAQYWSESAALNRAEVQQPRTASPDESTQKSFGANTKAFVAPSAPLYRFYNINTGAHLFTRDLTERDRTLNTLPQFRYEGAVFSAWASADAGLSPVYRFYNTRTGAHFFTISETEKAQIQASRPEMNLDGVAYYAAKTALAGTTGLYRFYHRQKGFHFYTTSAAERDSIVANLSATYNYEGVGYYVNAAVGSYDKALASFAGKVNTSGYVNGLGESARFKELRGMACNSGGDLFVTDMESSSGTDVEVRKITPAGVATSFVGNQNSPYDYTDGIGSGVTFQGLRAITFDSSGTGYVGDNKTVRTISPAGSAITIAGSLTATTGYVNGQAQAARFYTISGVVRDSGGNIFVSDTNNHAIRKITPSGVVTTFAGADPAARSAGYADGQGTAARFFFPGQLAIDTSDNLYVADEYNHRIRKISPTGLVTTLAGQASSGVQDGQGTAAKFDNPFAIAIDKATSNLYVGDWGGYTVRKITPNGTVTTVAGTAYSTGIYFGSLPAALDEIGGLAVCGGRLYIAANHAVLWTNLP
ncbi:hypothetical protein [Hydrogenophaga sp. RWCD_12]|uniref:hypothetical protein n=1 Tax=Hydrogenophaga sp. RWCD_12 TaxID=3391190 RepID=UPI0039846CFD